MTLFRSKLIIPLFVLILIWLGISIMNNRLQEDLVNNELSDVNERLGKLSRENEELEYLSARINDPAFIEKEARRKLNYKFPDEEVAYVYSDKNGEIVSKTESLIENNLNNYEKWWWYILGY